MSTISVDYDVLNQRGSPAWFSDTFANIPTAGYKGRMFISIDTFAFYRDTGTGWDLIGGPGIGTLTGSGVVGQVSFFNGTQVLAGNNNLFWDNTNSRLGINTTTPGQPLDIHSTGNTLVQLNNTATGNSKISFQNQNVAKWRVGNLYNAGANSFDISNATTSTTALSINNTNNYITINGIVDTGTNEIAASVYTARGDGTNAGSIYLKQRTSIIGAFSTYSSISASGTSLIRFGLNDGTTNRVFNFSAAGLSTTSRIYLLPDADGTMALTSNLSAYLPLAGGTLTGALSGTSATFSGNLVAGNGTNTEAMNVGGTLFLQTTADGSIGGKIYGYNDTSPNLYGGGLKFQTRFFNGSAYVYTDVLTATALGNVGIGTSSPSCLLHLQKAGGAGSVIQRIQNESIDGYSATHLYGSDGALKGHYGWANTSAGTLADKMYFGTIAAKDVVFTSNDTERMRLTSAGNLCIGYTTDAGYQLRMSGYLFVGGNIVVAGDGTFSNCAGSGSRAVLADANGKFTAPVSDISVKENIIPIGYGLNEIIKMKPIWFNYIDEYKNYGEERQNGNIAQEMQSIIPEAVFTTPTTGKMGINYDQLHAVYIKAIQELNEKLVRNNII